MVALQALLFKRTVRWVSSVESLGVVSIGALVEEMVAAVVPDFGSVLDVGTVSVGGGAAADERDGVSTSIGSASFFGSAGLAALDFFFS